jgi:hypothetical protein
MGTLESCQFFILAQPTTLSGKSFVYGSLKSEGVDMDNLNAQSQKQVYHKPQFRLYGNISSLTATVNSNTANTDSNPSGQRKTR